MASAGHRAEVTPPPYLLDTNSCIYLLARARPALTARIADCDAGSVGLSAVVCAELALGFDTATDPLKDMLERFLLRFPVLPFDEAAARAYARVPFRRGKFDRLIAAHALALDATLITSNVKDFSDIPGLKLEDWTRQ